jgi:DNA polymerase III epsilon subunit-like protein
MYILFLDVETNGLDAKADQVIEIGGVIVDVDPNKFEYKEVSSFEQVIYPRQEVSDKILRLTGITREELAEGKQLFTVQENWLGWLEGFEGKIEAVAGHSIDFDLGFLKAEQWYLPKGEVIDTLDLARILLPHKQAVNLEYLLETFKLMNESGHHRSLFDSRGSAKLFIHLLQQLHHYPVPDVFTEYFQKLILPNLLGIYTQTKDKRTAYTKSKELNKKNIINWQGKILNYSFGGRLGQFLSDSSYQKLTDLLESGILPHEHQILALQFIYAMVIFEHHSDWKYKLHVRQAQVDYHLVETFVRFLSDNQRSESNREYVIARAESLLWEIRDLAEEVLPVRLIQELLDQFTRLQLPSEVREEVRHFLNELDFLSLQIQATMKNNIMDLSLTNSSLKFEKVVRKWEYVMEQSKDLWQTLQDFVSKQETHEFYKTFIDYLATVWKFDDFDGVDNIHSYYAFGWLVVTKEREVNVPEILKGLEKKYGKVTLQTMIDPENAEAYAQIIGLKEGSITSLVDQSPEIVKNGKVDLGEFLPELLDQAEDKPILLLCALNSTLDQTKEFIMQELPHEPILIMGETGSLTKVASKLSRNPRGLVVIKASQFDKLLGMLGEAGKHKYFEQIWFLKRPFLYLHQYWLEQSHRANDSKVYLQKLRNLHIISQFNNVFTKSGVAPGLVEEI